MRRLHESGWSLADELLAGLAAAGYWLGSETKILDYGCGAGGLVYAFRDRGFDAYGFDIHDRVAYRNEEDRAFFRFIDNPQVDTSIQMVDPDLFEIDFPNDTFDVVISTSVLEHVLDVDSMMREIARVLKPTGAAFHLYPKPSVIIEPHIFVPFSSRIQRPWWFYLWAFLGVRNQFQTGMGAVETAKSNIRYTATGLRYRTDDELVAACSPYFRVARWVEDKYYATADRRAMTRARLRALRRPNPLWDIAPVQTLGILCTEAKREGIERIEKRTSPGYRLARPFSHIGGHSYTVMVPRLADDGDTVEAPMRSPFMLLEDGRPLGPAHSRHQDIAEHGRGRYSHWHGALYFSSSDGSDPNKNGRQYTLRDAPAADATETCQPTGDRSPDGLS